MNIEFKIKSLEKLIEKSKTVVTENSSDPNFKTWRNLVERTFIKIFGNDSTEINHFNDLKFYYPAMVYTASSDYTQDHLRVFREDFNILMDSINEYINELREELTNYLEKEKEEISQSEILSKVFISHSSKDSAVVEEIIDLLEAMGLNSAQIFCSSFEGYGIDVGENFLDVIKEELSSDCMVLFIISENFYKSPVCLCEMGATWVLAKEHIPILIPPIDYADIKGVIPSIQGLKITEPLKFNLLKEKIQNLFAVNNPTSLSTWERKRDRVISRINKVLN